MFSKRNFTLQFIFVLLYFGNTQEVSTQPYTRFSDQIVSPMFFNPAYSGAEKDELSLASKNKMHLSGRSPYQVFYGAIHSTVSRGIGKRHWLGLGLEYFKDVNRYHDHNSTKYNFNIGYHIPIGKKGTSQLSLGFRIGKNVGSYSKNFSQRLLSQNVEVINGPPFNADSKLFQPISNVVGGSGLLFISEVSDRLKLEISISLEGEIEPNRRLDFYFPFIEVNAGEFIFDCSRPVDMNSPLCNENFELFNGFTSNERSRFNSTLSIDYRLLDRLSIKPRLLIQDYDGQLDVLPQLLVDFSINERLSLIGGGGISSYDPMFYQVLLGARFDNMTLFFAFDTNFESGWTPGFLEEAIELSFAYSFPFQRKNE